MMTGDPPEHHATLSALAARVRQRAHAPYSRFKVGAALLAEDGTIHTGCNVENASYGLTICAERGAVMAAVADGRTRWRAIAVSATPPAAPCGACRQVLAEFAPELEVIVADGEGRVERVTSLAALLPDQFAFDGPDTGSGEP
jgi:cytidine deaminase